VRARDSLEEILSYNARRAGFGDFIGREPTPPQVGKNCARVAVDRLLDQPTVSTLMSEATVQVATRQKSPTALKKGTVILQFVEHRMKTRAFVRI
jgi:hypothetical protein